MAPSAPHRRPVQELNDELVEETLERITSVDAGVGQTAGTPFARSSRTRAKLFGMLEESGDCSDRTYGLTEAGTTTMRATIRAAAAGPMTK